MKKLLQQTFPLLIMLTGLTLTTSAQLKPVIYGDSLLCPNEGTVLHTQKLYDTYQWYVRDYFSNDKMIIPGATTSELTLGPNDVLKYFSVEVSLRGVKRFSDEKLIDGLAFLPPSVRSGGDFRNGPGFFALNEGDTGVFTLLPPYNTNITWYRNGAPIAGVTGNRLYVTAPGTYTVEGAPAECPNYIQHLGVDLVVRVRKNSSQQPVISGDTMLCPNASGTLTTQAGYDSYQWFKRTFGSNKKLPVAGATTNTLSINAYEDAPAYFSVAVTRNGDTLTAAEKLVDSYAFLPLSVISDGDFINGPGYFLLNEGDTGRFTITQPYDTNITWYRNNKVIAGETSKSLHVTTGGNYFVQAAPKVCPDFIQNPGLTLRVKTIADSLTSTGAAAAAKKGSANTIKLYPNPAKTFAMLDVSAVGAKQIDVTIAAQDGKTMFSKKYINAGPTIKIDLSTFKAGVYYVHAGEQVLTLVVAK